MSRVTACVVLAIYVLYVFHELKSPKRVVGPTKLAMDEYESQQLDTSSPQVPISSLTASPPALPPRTIRFADEDTTDESSHLKGDPRAEMGHVDVINDAVTAGTEVEHSGRPGMPGRSNSGPPGSVYRPTFSSRGHSSSLGSAAGRPSFESIGSEGRRALMRSALPAVRAMRNSCEDFGTVTVEAPPTRRVGVDRAISILILVVSSALMSMNAEFLVSTIDQITHEGHLSEALIGLIILPIVGNMAEYITVVTVAVREKLDLAIAVSVGSSVQIALCVAPLTVLAGWILDRDLFLTFNFFEMATLVGTVLLVNIIILSESGGASTSSALRGGLVCGCYAIIG